MFEKIYKKQQEIVEEIERIFNKPIEELTKEEKKDPRFIKLDKEYDRLELIVQTELF